MTVGDNSGGNVITRESVPQAQRLWLETYRSWRRFHDGVRTPGAPLLTSLGKYPRCVLVAGCQRSGTTMLTRLIARAQGFAGLALTKDDELDAALVLAGFVDLPQNTRYCFQTTYLNECFGEYGTLNQGQRLIWVVRNPYSVIYSMLNNWRRFALNELYEGCGTQTTSSKRLRRAYLPWPLGPSRLEKACLAYRGKAAQILAIKAMVKPDQLLVVDYDRLAAKPQEMLPAIFQFANAPYDPEYAGEVRKTSLSKAEHLSRRTRKLIERLTWQTYSECARLAAETVSV